MSVRLNVGDLCTSVMEQAADMGLPNVRAYQPDEADPPFTMLRPPRYERAGSKVTAVLDLSIVLPLVQGKAWQEAYETIIEQIDDGFCSKRFLKAWVCTNTIVRHSTEPIGATLAQLSITAELYFSAVATC